MPTVTRKSYLSISIITNTDISAKKLTFEIMGEDTSTGGLPIANLWFHQSVYEKEFEWSRIQGFAATSVDPG